MGLGWIKSWRGRRRGLLLGGRYCEGDNPYGYGYGIVMYNNDAFEAVAMYIAFGGYA